MKESTVKEEQRIISSRELASIGTPSAVFATVEATACAVVEVFNALGMLPTQIFVAVVAAGMKGFEGSDLQ